jgi:hypothetical protein
VKLRHPLSAYGDIQINIEGVSQLNNCLILPSMEKNMREAPFMQIDTEMRNAAQTSDLAIFLGSSLRDSDIEILLQSCESQIPTYTVTPEDSGPTQHGDHIQATASEFLISILPEAIHSDSLQETLNTLAKGERKTPTILDHMSTAFDPTQSGRPASIEYLANYGVQLNPEKIEWLLDDSDPRIRKYALGLVEDSWDTEPLIDQIKSLATEESHPGVQDEAKILLDYL